jgi:glutathione S-transferase
MLELHQFRHSAFCLKVRMILQAKSLSFRTVEVTPGVGQIDVFRLSGQRQVPVLVDGDVVVPDSSAIALHLEQRCPDPSLIPSDPRQRAQAHLLEDWADTTLASAARLALAQAAVADSALRVALLPDALPSPLRQTVGAFPGAWLQGLGEVVDQGERAAMLASLLQLADAVVASPWLVGDQCSIADLAVAAQLSLLRFPASSGEALAGRGVPGISDHPRLEPLFSWRDQLEAQLMQLDPAVSST